MDLPTLWEFLEEAFLFEFTHESWVDEISRVFSFEGGLFFRKKFEHEFDSLDRWIQVLIQKLSDRLLGLQQRRIILRHSHEPSDYRNGKVGARFVKVNGLRRRAEDIGHHFGVAVDVFPSTNNRDHRERKVETCQIEDLSITHLRQTRMVSHQYRSSLLSASTKQIRANNPLQ